MKRTKKKTLLSHHQPTHSLPPKMRLQSIGDQSMGGIKQRQHQQQQQRQPLGLAKAPSYTKVNTTTPSNRQIFMSPLPLFAAEEGANQRTKKLIDEKQMRCCSPRFLRLSSLLLCFMCVCVRAAGHLVCCCRQLYCLILSLLCHDR